MNLQETADKVYKEFGLRQIPILLLGKLAGHNRRNFAIVGLYCTDHIEIKKDTSSPLHTLIHELAHHLCQARFDSHIEGYYRMEMWPAMKECSNRPGWYSPTGQPKSVYLKTSSVHGKQFAKCYNDIDQFLKKEHNEQTINS